ncbi:MAG: hypothetical protein CL878_07510 [Dehalococcoidia bacterium]|nr:hypothetical protein [Dehalococcoidia bacterium]
MRWYVTLRPALVLGVGQPVSEIDVDACARAGIPVVRRSSGGAAVLADDGLLNLDVVLPAGHRLGSRDVVQAYAWLGAGLARSLGCLGWAARTVAPDEARRDTTALRAATNPRETTLHRTCFGGRSPHEVLVDERKVVGLCQVRRRAGTLYQIGILLQFDAARIAGLLSGPSAERSRGATQLGRRASGLQTLPLEHAELDRDVRGAVTTARQTGMQRVLDGVSPNHRASAGEIILGVERAIATIAMATYRLAEPCPATTIDERQLDG